MDNSGNKKDFEEDLIAHFEEQIANYYNNNLLEKKESISDHYKKILPREEVESYLEYADKKGNEIMGNAIVMDSSITKMVKGIEEKNVSTLIELDHRLKKATRLKEKIFESLCMHEYNMDDEVRLYDSLRYTFIIDDDKYTKKVDEYIDNIESNGYKLVKFKNSWSNPFYKGINAAFQDESGFMFEVQFHTPNGIYIKEHFLRVPYDVLRDNNTPKEVRSVCNVVRKYYQNKVEIPKDVLELKRDVFKKVK